MACPYIFLMSSIRVLEIAILAEFRIEGRPHDGLERFILGRCRHIDLCAFGPELIRSRSAGFLRRFDCPHCGLVAGDLNRRLRFRRQTIIPFRIYITVQIGTQDRQNGEMILHLVVLARNRGGGIGQASVKHAGRQRLVYLRTRHCRWHRTQRRERGVELAIEAANLHALEIRWLDQKSSFGGEHRGIGLKHPDDVANTLGQQLLFEEFRRCRARPFAPDAQIAECKWGRESHS